MTCETYNALSRLMRKLDFDGMYTESSFQVQGPVTDLLQSKVVTALGGLIGSEGVDSQIEQYLMNMGRKKGASWL